MQRIPSSDSPVPSEGNSENKSTKLPLSIFGTASVYTYIYIYIYIYIGKEACGSVFGAQKDIGQSKQVSNKSYHGRERQQEKYQDRAFTRC
jgi:hypothetical protein